MASHAEAIKGVEAIFERYVDTSIHHRSHSRHKLYESILSLNYLLVCLDVSPDSAI